MTEQRRQWVDNMTFVEAVHNDGNVHCEGWVVAYEQRPTFVIQTYDGRDVCWPAELTRRQSDDASA